MLHLQPFNSISAKHHIFAMVEFVKLFLVIIPANNFTFQFYPITQVSRLLLDH